MNVRRDAQKPAVLEYMVRLKTEITPAELVGALDERWSAQVSAAEYVPFRTRRKERKEPKKGRGARGRQGPE